MSILLGHRRLLEYSLGAFVSRVEGRGRLLGRWLDGVSVPILLVCLLYWQTHYWETCRRHR